MLRIVVPVAVNYAPAGTKKSKLVDAQPEVEKKNMAPLPQITVSMPSYILSIKP